MADSQELRRTKSKVGQNIEDRRHWKRASIRDILSSMQAEADDHYNGQLSDNALTIFNMLIDGEKRTFLRSAIAMLYQDQLERSMRNEDDEVDVDTDLKIDFTQITKERADFSEIEKIEHIKFVNFFTRFIFVILLAVFAWFIYFIATYGIDDPSGELIKYFLDYTEYLVDFIQAFGGGK